MHKTFKYRFYPTKKQQKKLEQTLELCRYVFNETLAVRRNAWQQRQKSLSLYDTNAFLRQWKTTNPTLYEVFSQCLQQVQVRVDLAFKAFFRRVKAGQNPGYPRFKGIGRYDSFTFPQQGMGFKVNGNMLKLSKIGTVKLVLHRYFPSTIKTLTIKKTATGKWFACFCCEVSSTTLPASNKAVGIDVGLTTFATLSNGKKIPNPRFFKHEQKALTKAQKKQNKKVTARIHERIANKRADFAHKVSRSLVNNYGVIAFENLNIKGMLQNSFLAKSIQDAAWNQLIQYTTYKAEDAGRRVVLVDPKGTSQRCSRCGTKVPKDLSVRKHHCPICSLSIGRDLNAAINILALGLQCLGVSPRSPQF